ncbi:related to Putative magnesium-dependent phosphatase YER134C [Saccharomycodes ludwigii]|uniref:Related to Putative magnesium-dependent phosphatase YER134C n=1 Tax=Saccharomycodes ludwigii TaxID=36035 RepID=A0A376B3H3_9ASCO|nr:hypothetical protein SCDLUD_001583 [Saccharomycodes ludwigii]KAH3901801.1 hypothetical protein SCDLUD_001583 [Saccharomycodes ludwigii]SSD59024.1 related to Putative magnesium-dependent phosphatase YER134C [Saccharomycodes ludwigii]
MRPTGKNPPQDKQTANYPDVAFFDLDYTVWPCYCDTHLSPPFKPIATEKQQKNGIVTRVVDSYGYELEYFPDIPRILIDLHKNGVKLVTASRTWAPNIAIELLHMFTIQIEDGATSNAPNNIISLYDIFDAFQWGDHSKQHHINNALNELYPTVDGDNNKEKKKNNLRVVLFDDERRNIEVEKRKGCKFVFVKNPDEGLTWEIYQEYLKSL